MKTRIEGRNENTFVITTGNTQEIVECTDSIVKLWLSSGTILGMKYGNMLDPSKWLIRILYGPVDSYVHTQYHNNPDCHDVFETEEEVVNMKIIPRTSYVGGNL